MENLQGYETTVNQLGQRVNELVTAAPREHSYMGEVRAISRNASIGNYEISLMIPPDGQHTFTIEVEERAEKSARWAVTIHPADGANRLAGGEITTYYECPETGLNLLVITPDGMVKNDNMNEEDSDKAVSLLHSYLDELGGAA